MTESKYKLRYHTFTGIGISPTMPAGLGKITFTNNIIPLQLYRADGGTGVSEYSTYSFRFFNEAGTEVIEPERTFIGKNFLTAILSYSCEMSAIEVPPGTYQLSSVNPVPMLWGTNDKTKFVFVYLEKL